jgi:hypothetical protein
MDINIIYFDYIYPLFNSKTYFLQNWLEDRMFEMIARQLNGRTAW